MKYESSERIFAAEKVRRIGHKSEKTKKKDWKQMSSRSSSLRSRSTFRNCFFIIDSKIDNRRTLMNFDYGSKIDRPSDIDEIKTPPVAHTKDDSLQIREHVKRVAFGLLSKKKR